MSTLGLFNTTNWAPNQLKKSFNSRLLMKYPGTPAMLTALSARFKSTDITSHRHHFAGKSMVFSRGTITAPIPAAKVGQQMQISVNDSTTFVPGAVILVNTTDEQMHVVSIAGPNSIIVRRGFGISPALPIAAGAMIWQIGNAYEEGSLRPLAKSYSYEEWDNITQIFRNSWALTGTVHAESPLTGQSVAVTSKAEAAQFHAIEKEMAMIWGERHSSFQNGQPLRKMDGIISSIKQHAPSNIRYAASTTTFEQLGNMVNSVFDVSTDMTMENDRLMLVGNKAYSVLNALGRSSGIVQMNQSQTKFGMQFTEFMTDVGNLKIVKHPLFNVNPEWSSMALVVDPSSLELNYLRRTTHNTFNSDVNNETIDGEEGGMDAIGGDFKTEFTLSNLVPEANAVIYGLCEAAVKLVVTAPETFSACLSISNPCDSGTVDGGAVVILAIQGYKPSTDVQVSSPTGTPLTITIDANGNGTKQYTMPTVPGTYAFSVIPSNTVNNVTWTSPIVIACVKDCLPVKVESNSCEADTMEGVTAPVLMESLNCPTDTITGVGSIQS
jgi:Family of unknown function (DUF5309)